MTEWTQDNSTEVESLCEEINRLNKIVTVLMNRVERDMSQMTSDFGIFQTTVVLEKQVRDRTRELEIAVRENGRINHALQREKDEQRVLIEKLEQAHNQVLQSEKLASIGQLAAGVAHEINNPIGFVNSNLVTLDGYVNRLFGLIDSVASCLRPVLTDHPELKGRFDKLCREADLEFLRQDVRSLVQESLDGTARVRRIVQDLRDFSRTGSSHLEDADLHAGLESTLNVVWNEIKFKAKVVRDYGEIPPVECRPSQINQVFLNLLVNAAQAIAETGEIRVSTGLQGEQVWIAFSDTGCGIPPEIQARIFDPFFTTKPVGRGTGLGLSVSYGIVKKHGGRIDLESCVGRGTTFTVWLPVRQDLNAE